MEIVILLWSTTVAFTLIIGTLGVIVGKLVFPGMNVASGAEVIANIVMAMVGFIGGRAVGKLEADGGKP